jgi:spore germination cell wall hydrolase CwlJ-like protein
MKAITYLLLAGAHLITPALASTGTDCEDYRESDRVALACNIYFEAHTEGYDGMMAVATVTLNRVGSRHYPDTVREVVWARKQFSWTHDGKVDIPKNRRHWKTAMQIAALFTITRRYKAIICPTATQIMASILGRPDPGCEAYRNLVAIHVVTASLVDQTGGALLYHADYVEPYWIDPRYRSAVLGAHWFYTRARITKVARR